MDCRKLAVLAALFAVGSSGCLNGGQKTSPTPEPMPENVVLKKDGAKRQPSANLLTKTAVLHERQAEQINDPDAKTNMRDKARSGYQEALKVDPNFAEAQEGLARIYVKLGDYEHAMDAYQKALAKNPKNAYLWLELAMCHNQKKDFAGGLKCLSKALEIDPENRGYLKTMGFTLARAGQPDQALVYLTKAVGPAGAHYNLARMHLHMKQMDLGRQQLALALQANPDYEPARQLLANLDQPNSAALGLEFQGSGQ